MRTSPTESSTTRFADRAEAGRALAEALEDYRGRDHLVVIGLARGGVPVAYEVAARLEAPLEVFVVRKLGVPGHEELAMGAIASGGVRVLNQRVVDGLAIEKGTFERVIANETDELSRRERLYRSGRPPIELRDTTAILVDDGLATGSSMLAAVRALQTAGTRAVVAAVPVAPEDTCEAIREEADEVVCARTPRPFLSVGTYYDDFAQTTDEDVRALLARAAEAGPHGGDG
jgi:putative phosphoribosyl transferase